MQPASLPFFWKIVKGCRLHTIIPTHSCSSTFLYYHPRLFLIIILLYLYLFCLCMCYTLHNTCRPSLRTVNQWLSWLQMNALWSLILIQRRSLCSLSLSLSSLSLFPPPPPHTFTHTGLASTSLLLGDVSGTIDRSQTSRARLITWVVKNIYIYIYVYIYIYI